MGPALGTACLERVASWRVASWRVACSGRMCTCLHVPLAQAYLSMHADAIGWTPDISSGISPTWLPKNLRAQGAKVEMGPARGLVASWHAHSRCGSRRCLIRRGHQWNSVAERTRSGRACSATQRAAWASSRLLDGGEVAIDQHGIGQRPEVFGGLQFRRVRRQEEQVQVVGHAQALGCCASPPGPTRARSAWLDPLPPGVRRRPAPPRRAAILTDVAR